MTCRDSRLVTAALKVVEQVQRVECEKPSGSMGHAIPCPRTAGLRSGRVIVGRGGLGPGTPELGTFCRILYYSDFFISLSSLVLVVHTSPFVPQPLLNDRGWLAIGSLPLFDVIVLD
jgi:hypothetical protein